ncbi:MAG: hypothetical protein IJ743_01395 [Bacilli bacterium]|nr:hypothetical protein [Bacilli bacterium]
MIVMEDSSKRNMVIIVILLIIILILFFFIRFGKIESYALIPTGNVDVFDIDVRCKCESSENGTSCITIDGDGNEIGVPVYHEKTDRYTLGKVFVDDKNGDVIYQKNLSIFENAAFKYTTKIAPGVSNVYQFVVHNSTDTPMKYSMQMYEDTEYSINLKYRLKRNDVYVIGNDDSWVSASELQTKFSRLDVADSDKYSLDWKWFDSDNDTEIGKNMTSEYHLYVRFSFEAVVNE